MIIELFKLLGAVALIWVTIIFLTDIIRAIKEKSDGE